VKRWIASFLALIVLLALPAEAFATYAKSTSFSVDETLLGGTGLPAHGQSSTNFSARTEAGDIVVGDTSTPSGNQTRTGNVSDAEPALSFSVNTPNATFSPDFSRTAVSNAQATFSVKNYTSHGYSVFLYGTTPSNNGYDLPALAANTASTPGTEQFGVNLVANTGFGSNPAQVPSSSFSYGLASANYNTANSFRFVSGEQVAQADKSSGQTDFTLSYIVNVKGNTPGGKYTAKQQLICVGTY
jgi:hypothetical protein